MANLESVSPGTTDLPPYRLLLPAGWEEVSADREGVGMLIERTSSALRAQHRPELDVQMRTLLERALRGMQTSKAVAIYLQTEAAEMPLPMSITASIVDGQFGGTLDRQVTGLFRDHAAMFLTDDHTIVRWETAVGRRRTVDGVAAHTVSYLIPVPGTNRKRGLQFTTTIPLPANADDAEEMIVERLVQLSDVLISTFTWLRAPE